jgi:hypothetical protein
MRGVVEEIKRDGTARVRQQDGSQVVGRLELIPGGSVVFRATPEWELRRQDPAEDTTLAKLAAAQQE